MENKKKINHFSLDEGLVSTGMLRVGAHGAATGTEPSWDRDPELSDT